MWDVKSWLASQNQRIIDAIRKATGLGNQADYGVRVAPYIQPVLVVDPFCEPPAYFGGTTIVNIPAGGVGFRSEAAIAVSAAEKDVVVEVFIRVSAGNQSWEVILSPTISGATQVPTLPNDLRLGTGGTLPQGVVVTKKNSAAATGTGVEQGSDYYGLTSLESVRIGPYYLTENPGSKTMMVRPTADNVPISAIFDWRILKRAV